MAYFLFALYLLLCSLAVVKIDFFRRAPIPPRHLIAYFWLKVSTGLVYGYYFASQPKGRDTWKYHRESLVEKKMLLDDPLQFITSTFSSSYESGYGGFLATKNSWWNDLDANTIPKLLGICNVLSGDNYYINVIFINFIFLLGPVLLFKLWTALLPGQRLLWRYLPFLVPSFLFWTSGIHKEGFLTIALAFIAYALFSLLQKWGSILKNIALLLIGLLIVTVLRNFLLLPLCIALLAWVVAAKIQISSLGAFAASLVIFACILGAPGLVVKKLDFPALFSERRAAFAKLKGSSRTETVQLKPIGSSLLQNAPAAFITGGWRPLPFEMYNATSALAAMESVLLLLLVGAVLLKYKPPSLKVPFIAFCFVFACLVFLIVGYTIPFLGAVVRYRSIVLPFFVMGLVVLLPQQWTLQPQPQKILTS